MIKSQPPTVNRYGVLDCQVCVPKNWTDDQVLEFANTHNPTGLQSGWVIRKQGDPALGGCNERVPCEHPLREGCVHIMLDC